MTVYRQAAQSILQSRRAVALTGAGISVESGIPDFRSSTGLWARYDPMEYAHIESFLGNPAKVWKMLLEMDRLVSGAEPNPAHFALAELERIGRLQGVITQNIDSLHQRAGSCHVVEFHGHGRTLGCVRCDRHVARETVNIGSLPPLCECGGVLRPDLVFFGEGIPLQADQEARNLVANCDLLLIVGTSASVAPASSLPRLAKRNGAKLIEINTGPTELAEHLVDLRITKSAGVALPAILEAMGSPDIGT